MRYCPTMTERSSVIVGSVGFGLVALTSTPALLALYARVRPQKDSGYQRVDALYEDGDGAATVATQKAFSTTVPRSLALLGSVVGLLLSVAAAVISTTHPGRALFVEGWVAFGSWVRATEHRGCGDLYVNRGI